MRYRVCKAFEVESGHLLMKHPGRCRHPHGHTRRIEVVVSSETLDERDMVCDFKALRLAIGGFIDGFDHAMAINADDPALPLLREATGGGRLVVFNGEDPTTEAMARRIFEHLRDAIARGEPMLDEEGRAYPLPSSLRLERVRVGETPSSWAEYGVS